MSRAVGERRRSVDQMLDCECIKGKALQNFRWLLLNESGTTWAQRRRKRKPTPEMMLCVEPESLCPLQAELHLPQEEKEDFTDGVIMVYKSDLWMYPNSLSAVCGIPDIWIALCRLVAASILISGGHQGGRPIIHEDACKPLHRRAENCKLECCDRCFV